MKIFNEDLKKHLLFDELLFVLYGGLSFIFSIIGSLIISITVGLVIKQLINHYPSYSIFLNLIMFLLSCLLSVLLVNKISSHFYSKSEYPPSNPTLNKLKNTAKQQDCINLVKLWEYFNPYNPSNSIVLDKEQKDIELLTKLDDDLVHFMQRDRKSVV